MEVCSTYGYELYENWIPNSRFNCKIWCHEKSHKDLETDSQTSSTNMWVFRKFIEVAYYEKQFYTDANFLHQKRHFYESYTVSAHGHGLSLMLSLCFFLSFTSKKYMCSFTLETGTLPRSGWVYARMKLAAGHSFQVSLVGERDPGYLNCYCCLRTSTFPGSWYQNLEREVNLRWSDGGCRLPNRHLNS